MQSDTLVVLNLSVAREFSVSSADSPMLDEIKQPATDALPSMSGSHVPTLKIRYRRRSCALHVIAAHRHFRKSDQLPIGIGYNDNSIAREKLLDLQLVAIGRALGPKLKTESHPNWTIRRRRNANGGLHA